MRKRPKTKVIVYLYLLYENYVKYCTQKKPTLNNRLYKASIKSFVFILLYKLIMYKVNLTINKYFKNTINSFNNIHKSNNLVVQ